MLVRMGQSNRTAALERKISMPMGEREEKARQIERAEREYARVFESCRARQMFGLIQQTHP